MSSSSESIEISDVDEEPLKEIDLEKFQTLVSKAWNTCASGFDTTNSGKPSKKDKGKSFGKDDQSKKKHHKRLNSTEDCRSKKCLKIKTSDIPTETSSPQQTLKSLPSRKKGSEWLKSIQWDLQSVPSDNLGISEEKKLIHGSQKFIEGGFAEQALRFQKKERSDRVIWYHKKSENTKKYVNSVLCLVVNTCSEVNGLFFLKCAVLNAQASSNSAKSHNTVLSCDSKSMKCPISSYKKASSYQNSSQCPKAKNPNNFSETVDKPETNVYLLLRNVKYCSGSVIQIFPPWRTLEITGIDHPVILGPNFIDIKTYKVESSEFVHCVTERVIYAKNNSVETDLSSQYSGSNTVGKMGCRKSEPSDTECEILNFGISKRVLSQSSSSQSSIPLSVSASSQSSNLSQNLSNYRDVPQKTTLSQLSKAISKVDDLNKTHHKAFSVSARIQRMYHYVSDWKASGPSSDVQTNVEVSLLLQDTSSQFCELQLLNIHRQPNNSIWWDIINAGEGSCFNFEKVEVKEKMPSSKYPTLFAVLQHILLHQNSTNGISHPICYQAIVNCQKTSPNSIPEDLYPPFCHYELCSVDEILACQGHSRKFGSFVVRILCDSNNILYVSDRSLLKKNGNQYVPLRFHKSSFKPPLLNQGFVILITDPAISNKSFYVDKYSTISLLSTLPNGKVDTILCASKRLPLKIVQDLVSLQMKAYSWTFLSSVSRVGDIVLVEGEITDVDSESSLCSLECNMCGNENLYGDVCSVIYCKICDFNIKKPSLSMKMVVHVSIPLLQFMLVNVQLTSSTTKRILKVPDHETQPKCEIKDVISQRVGPIFCCIKNRETFGSKMSLDLLEILQL